MADFEARCAAFCKACNYEVVRKRNNKTSEEVILLRFDRRPTPDLRAKATSVLTGARHALDQAVCDAAIQLGRKDAKKIYFPVAQDAADLEKAIVSRCKGVDTDLLDFIRATKPYYGGNDIIREGCRITNDKHVRVIGLSLGGSYTTLISNENLDIQGPCVLWINKWNYITNELEYARIGPGGHFNMDIDHPVSIVLGEGKPPFAGSAATALGDFISETDSIILGIKAETARILAGRC